MTMRKLLPLVLLAIGAIFLLSSCDALLDAIYPNNTITVSVAVPRIDHGDWLSATVYVTLNGAAATPTLSQVATGYDAIYAYFDFPSFTKLPNGDYTITAQYNGPVTGIQVVQYSLHMPYSGSNNAPITIYFP